MTRQLPDPLVHDIAWRSRSVEEFEGKGKLAEAAEERGRLVQLCRELVRLADLDDARSVAAFARCQHG